MFGRTVLVGLLLIGVVARDTGPFIGLIVSSERIDGIWSGRMSDSPGFSQAASRRREH
jgi:hypothetical protein